MIERSFWCLISESSLLTTVRFPFLCLFALVLFDRALEQIPAQRSFTKIAEETDVCHLGLSNNVELITAGSNNSDWVEDIFKQVTRKNLCL